VNRENFTVLCIKIMEKVIKIINFMYTILSSKPDSYIACQKSAYLDNEPEWAVLCP
jgi:hypothetical protein